MLGKFHAILSKSSQLENCPIFCFSFLRKSSFFSWEQFRETQIIIMIIPPHTCLFLALIRLEKSSFKCRTAFLFLWGLFWSRFYSLALFVTKRRFSPNQIWYLYILNSSNSVFKINKQNIFLQIHLKSKLSKIGITAKAKK